MQTERLESVMCKDEACVLQIDLEVFQTLNKKFKDSKRQKIMNQDYKLLMYIFECHYEEKNSWREQVRS